MTPVVEKLGAAVDEWVAKNNSQLVATRRHLHAHPELAFAEFETTSFLEQRLRTGAITAACDRMDVTLTGPGGHTARPQLTVDLVDALGRLITDLPGLLSRQVDPRAGMSLVWGAVNAGIAANAIPQRGRLSGTVRVLDRDAWKDAEDLMRSLVERVAATTGAEVDVDYIRGVPPVVNDPRAVALLRTAALETVGSEHVLVSPQSMGGEDFGWFADIMPIALARLGTHGGGDPLDLHRGTFDVDESAIGVGVRLLARTALHALEADAAPPRTGRRAPGDTSARRSVDERREPDDEFHRPAG
jgi:metal-dependent amidase/aminoacylase/carboxypeptidase family protein